MFTIRIPDSKSDFRASLPAWAQKIWQVTALAERNAGYRCNVFSAQHNDYRRKLIREALNNVNAQDAARWENF